MTTVHMLPALATAISTFLTVKLHWHPLKSVLGIHLISACLFGASVSLHVLLSERQSAWFLMPLFLAPLEYLLHYWGFIVFSGLALYLYASRNRTH